MKTEVEKQVLDEAKTRVEDCPQVNPGLSGSRETAQNKSSENRPQPKSVLFVAKSKPIATKFEPYGQKAIGELPLGDHRPI